MGISSHVRKAHSTVWAGIPCHFPAGALCEPYKVGRKSCSQKRLRANSLDSLRLSLHMSLNLQILGRICRIQGFERENSLLNSLLQGIALRDVGDKKARLVCPREAWESGFEERIRVALFCGVLTSLQHLVSFLLFLAE